MEQPVPPDLHTFRIHQPSVARSVRLLQVALALSFVLLVVVLLGEPGIETPLVLFQVAVLTWATVDRWRTPDWVEIRTADLTFGSDLGWTRRFDAADLRSLRPERLGFGLTWWLRFRSGKMRLRRRMSRWPELVNELRRLQPDLEHSERGST